jgi:uncharacterized integral membrane protein
MAYLTLIITIPLTLFALAFAASNSTAVKAGLWPLEQTWELPLSILGLGMLGTGFLSGALFVWLLYQKMRYRYWQESRKVARLEKELDSLHQKAEAEKPGKPSQPPSTAIAVK